MNFEKRKLSELCSSISDGDHQPPPKVEQGIPFVTIANITSTNKFDFSNSMFVPQEYYDSLDNKRKAQKGDILYSVVGSFGTPVYMTEDIPFVFQRHIAILRPNETIDSRFLYYTMKSRDFYMMADAAAIGAAQRTVSLTSLRNMEISVPPLETQHRIASILSAYDDLIENNQKQIKLLEEAAQRLYKEWFVDLRFPGYEDIQIVDGVPEGWKIEKIGNFVSTTSGGTPSRTHKEYYESGTNLWVKTQELKDSYIIDTDEKITDEAIKKSSAKIIPNGSLLLAMYGATIGKLGIANCDLTCNQACCVFLFENDIWKREYLYCWLIENRILLVSQGKGAAQPNLSQALIKSIDIIIPNEILIKRFSKITSVLFQKKCNLEIQIKSLYEARDRLLPKLMNGELEV